MFLLRPMAIGMTTLGIAACNSSNEPTTSIQERALSAVEAAETELIAFRHDLHRFPELAGEEVRTSQKVATALSELGFDVSTNVGGYGVVGILEGDPDGPLIAFRADMDAVAGDALDPVPYASEVEGAHHTCGHDIHTTIGIALAEGFAAIKSDLPGSVMLIFQPAEEAGTGAEAMLANGLFGDQTPDAIFAVHAAPLDLGDVATLPNGMLAGRALMTLSLKGDGDLEAATSALRESVMAVGNVTPETMFGFQTDPFIFVDLFPQDAVANGQSTIRGFAMSAGINNRPIVEEKLREAITSAQFDDIEVSVTFRQALEGVNNDPALVAHANAAIEARAPALNVFPAPGVIPAFSEDFGSFQRSVPGVMYLLGVNNPELGTVGFPHSPDFVADDGSIFVGTEAMLSAMLDRMSDHSGVNNPRQ